MLVTKRFLRNRLAIVGSIIIILMFLFSFIGGFITPYGEAQVFTHDEYILRDYAFATVNQEYQITMVSGDVMSASARGAFVSAIGSGSESFVSGDKNYTVSKIGDDFYELYELSPVFEIAALGGRYAFTALSDYTLSAGEQDLVKAAIDAGESTVEIGGAVLGLTKSGKMFVLSAPQVTAIASKYIFSPLLSGMDMDYTFKNNAETAISTGAGSFTAGGAGYLLEEHDGEYIIKSGDTNVAVMSRLTVRSGATDIIISLDFREKIAEAVADGTRSFVLDGIDYTVEKNLDNYTIRTEQKTQKISLYQSPSSSHWLGTDGNGMDLLTRLMYGGRISLMIGFVVVVIEVVLGIILGGVAGFFGGFIDNLIMRIVDIFNCIPSIPLYLIMGAAMDGAKVDPQIRIYSLMLVMGLLSWPSIARVVRGQILSLREQEFMVATEACGIRATRRIFRHLIPNVIPQLIVLATMGLGSVIIAESTLSFLGMGVKFPFASWGSIVNSVNDIFVMRNYLFAWVPAGCLILLTVLGFNFIGDGLRDAFDPKMKR